MIVTHEKMTKEKEHQILKGQKVSIDLSMENDTIMQVIEGCRQGVIFRENALRLYNCKSLVPEYGKEKKTIQVVWAVLRRETELKLKSTAYHDRSCKGWRDEVSDEEGFLTIYSFVLALFTYDEAIRFQAFIHAHHDDTRFLFTIEEEQFPAPCYASMGESENYDFEPFIFDDYDLPFDVVGYITQEELLPDDVKQAANALQAYYPDDYLQELKRLI